MSNFRFKNASFESNINHTNDMYGGFNPDVTNVYFTHGSLDPWHRMGVLSDLNKHSPSTVIPGKFECSFGILKLSLLNESYFAGISHCRDLGAINYKSDSKELINSKVTIMNLVKKWLRF